MSMRFTYPSHAANKKAETKSGGYAPKNRAANPTLQFRSKESIPNRNGFNTHFPLDLFSDRSAGMTALPPSNHLHTPGK